MSPVDIKEQQPLLEAYLVRTLVGDSVSRSPVKLVNIRQLTRSTREAPWLLEVDIDGSLRRYVLRFGPAASIKHEHDVLQAMERIPLPTPTVHALDVPGAILGHPCFISDFIEGDSLLGPMLAGEPWAEDLYVDSVCALLSVTAEQLGVVGQELLPGQPATDIVEETHKAFQQHPHPLADHAYLRLKETIPRFPELRFSNGDLYLDNFLEAGQNLAGIIDFEHAGFSDPVYEFLLSFFVHRELRGRGTEKRFCRRIGADPGALHWYRGLEYYELLEWTHRTGRPFVGHTAESLGQELEGWLG